MTILQNQYLYVHSHKIYILSVYSLIYLFIFYGYPCHLTSLRNGQSKIKMIEIFLMDRYVK